MPSRIARFEVRSLLGGGAFGVVYCAYDPQLEREVAIKVPRPGTLNTPKRVERFLGDAKAAAQLRHPHIVPVFDCGKDGDLIYIATAYVRGQTLGDAVDPGPMEFGKAAAIVMKLADALAYAHANGIIHRDVKPDNIVLDHAGEPHIIDFGLAHRGGETERGRMILGTPSYMSPEQAAGESGDAKPAFDQYALGVTLYELLTGHTPFSGPSKIQMYHHVNTVPAPPREMNPNIPLDLQLICLKALAKHTDNRYPDCAAFASDLRRYLAGEVPSVRTLTRKERLVRWVKTEPRLAGAVGVVGLLVVVLAILGASFGVSQRNQNRLLTNANAETEAARLEAVKNEGIAKENAVIAEANADKARKAEKHALGELAGAMFDRAVVVGEQGEIGQCLVDLAKSLDMAERAENSELSAVIRQNLAGWRQQAHRLAAVRSIRVSPGWIAIDPKGTEAVLYGSSTPQDAEHVLICPLSGETTTTNWIRVTWDDTPIRTATTSPDGRVLLTISVSGNASVFEAMNGQPIGKPITPRSGKFLSGAVFPDGRRIVLGDSTGRVSIFTRDTGEWESAQPIGGHTIGMQVRAVAVHSSGSWVLSAGGSRLEGEIIVWNASTFAKAYTLPRKGENLMPVTSAAFSPGSGSVFVTGHGTLLNGEARAWDTTTGTPLRDGILRHQAEVNAVSFSPDGRFLATASQDRSARVFATESWAMVGQPLWHGKDVRAVVFSSDGQRLITGANEGSDGGAIRVWELAPGPSAVPSIQLSTPVLAVATSPRTNRLFAGGFRSSAWNTRTQSLVPGDWQHGFPILAADYHPSEKKLLLGSGTADSPGSAVIVDDAGAVVAGPFPHPKGVLSVAFSPDGKRFATGCLDGHARVWDLKNPGAMLAEFPHHPKLPDGRETGKVYVVQFTPDSRYLFSGGTDKHGILWDLNEPLPAKPVHRMPHPDAVLSVAFSSDSKRIITGYVGAVSVWNWTPGRVPESDGLLLHGPAGIFAVDISPDGKTVLTAGTDGTARWWDLKTRKPLGPMWHPGPTAKAVAFWPDTEAKKLKFVTAGTDLQTGRVMMIDKPSEVTQQTTHVALWVEACTGIGTRLAVLDPAEWRKKHKQLLALEELQIERDIRNGRRERPVTLPTSPIEPKMSGSSPPAGSETSPIPVVDPPAVSAEAKRIIGKWTSNDLGPPAVAEFSATGKVILTIDFGGMPQKIEGTFKLIESKLELILDFGGTEQKETLTITKITENEITGKSKDGMNATFKRVGAAPKEVMKEPVKKESEPVPPRKPAGNPLGGLINLGKMIFGRP